jgi:DNA modification methylase
LKTISNRIIKTALISWRELKWFHTDLKKLPGESLEKLKQSLVSNNFVQPFNVWQLGRTVLILDGQYRMKAMQVLEKEGYEIPDLLPANFIQCKNRADAARMVLLYSSIYANITEGGLDSFAQANNLDIPALSLEINLPDFKLDEYLQTTGDAGDTDLDVDEAPEPPGDPRTRPGDLYELGPHRLLCGDATSLEAARLLFGEERAACVFTDPPYGVSYVAPSGNFDMIVNDDRTEDDLVNNLLLPALKVAVAFTLPNAGFYIWHASSTREDFSFALKAAGLLERQYIIWAKPGFILGHSDYRWAHEPCFYASKEGKVPAFYGDRSQSTVWRATIQAAKRTSAILGTGLVLIDGSGGRIYLEPKAPNGKKVRTMRVLPGQTIFISSNDRADDLWEIGRDDTGDHPTQKPVALARRALENSSLPGDIVYDGFLGSGTTLIAAELTGRICFGTELTPDYCDVIVDRYVRTSGNKEITLNGSAVEWRPLHGE